MAESSVDAKKAWQRPELVILTRHKPEEAVLTSCKGAVTGGVATANYNCDTNTYSCTYCATQSDS